MQTQTKFFIAGAPRCGTTAMSKYLSEHPDVCFSDPKEPLYFCTDLPGLRFVENETDYISQCFDQYKLQHCTAAGEGSVWYLYSKEAIPNILRFDPDAKFIFMVRNPIDLLASLHQKLFLFLDEDEPDFPIAWGLQEKRKLGLNIAATCREPQILRYAEIGRLGAQIQRAFNLIPEEQRLVITFDEFEKDTLSVYRSVLNFLDLEYDGRTTFQKLNQNQRVKNRYLLERAWNPPARLMAYIEWVKALFGIRRLNLLVKIRNKLAVSEPRAEIDALFREKLIQEFAEDIDLLSKLINKDLGAWKVFREKTGSKSETRTPLGQVKG